MSASVAASSGGNLHEELLDALQLLMARRTTATDPAEQTRLDREADRVELALLRLGEAETQGATAELARASAALASALSVVRETRAAAPRLLLVPATPQDSAAPAAGFDEAGFVAFVNGLGLKHFKPYELLVMGNQHADKTSPAFGLNGRAPRELWENISATARVLDALRARLGAPIRITNAYRTPAYNRAIGGARDSQHVLFRALDFVAEGGSRPGDWARTLRSMRDDEGAFRGGVGLYDTFVHVDTRGENADWSPAAGA